MTPSVIMHTSYQLILLHLTMCWIVSDTTVNKNKQDGLNATDNEIQTMIPPDINNDLTGLEKPPVGILLRLGNSTIDSSKTFRVPSYLGITQRPVSYEAVLISEATIEERHTEVHNQITTPDSRRNHLKSGRFHHHHDRRYGPNFEDVPDGSNATDVTVQVGDTAYLNCKVSLLQDKTVSWVRRKQGVDGLELLTVGLTTYSGDSRYSVEFRYPGNWRLQIRDANKSDEGQYECQISTHPPRVILYNLNVNAPQVSIIDEVGAALSEQFYEAESTLSLRCIARDILLSSSLAVHWLHAGRVLNFDTIRGGVSVKTEMIPPSRGADSVLRLNRVSTTDSGNYTCSVGVSETSFKQYTVTVHVLNESLAELHQGALACHLAAKDIILFSTLLILIINICLR